MTGGNTPIQEKWKETNKKERNRAKEMFKKSGSQRQERRKGEEDKRRKTIKSRKGEKE